MGNVDPLTARTFRQTQVFVGEHTPPAASDVELLMEEFVRLLRSHTVRSIPFKLQHSFIINWYLSILSLMVMEELQDY